MSYAQMHTRTPYLKQHVTGGIHLRNEDLWLPLEKSEV